MAGLATLRTLSRTDCGLLAEALFTLALASAVVALVPFRVIGKLAGRRSAPTAPPNLQPAMPGRVRWAVTACARRAPFRAKCFEQGLACVWMLRRRGVSATLHYGAAQEGEKLLAHVWVTAEGEPVIGCENKERFSELARFPAGEHAN